MGGEGQLLGIVGVVTLRGNRWRSGALLATALALSLVALDLFAGLLSPMVSGSVSLGSSTVSWVVATVTVKLVTPAGTVIVPSALSTTP